MRGDAVIRLALLGALIAALAQPALAAPRRGHRTICVTYHDPGVGPVRICGLPVRGR